MTIGCGWAARHAARRADLETRGRYRRDEERDARGMRAEILPKMARLIDGARGGRGRCG
jgi:hypothetical protein